MRTGLLMARVISAFLLGSPILLAQPVISSIQPTGGVAAAGVAINVIGYGFVNGSAICLNGTEVPTTFVSATQLGGNVPASLLVTAGIVAVTVQNPGATSAPYSFTIFEPSPTVSGISPTSRLRAVRALS
jgi:uncharacterized protein (TIGR03437 family)